MLVMSFSSLLGQAIPDIAETAEILVFPRRGYRSDSSRVSKPREEVALPAEEFLEGLGWCTGRSCGTLLAPFWGFLPSRLHFLRILLSVSG